MHALNNGKLWYCNNYDCFLYVRESVSSSIIRTESCVHVPIRVCLNGVDQDYMYEGGAYILPE